MIRSMAGCRESTLQYIDDAWRRKMMAERRDTYEQALIANARKRPAPHFTAGVMMRVFYA